MKKDIRKIETNIKWSEAAKNRDRWQDLYLAVYGLKGRNQKRRRISLHIERIKLIL